MRKIPENKLNKKVVSVWRIGGIISTVFVAIIIAAIVIPVSLSLDEWMPWLPIGAVLVIIWACIDIIIVPNIRYNRWRYDVTEDEVDIYYGIIVRKRIIIPLVRVQFTDTKQGPIKKAFGLAEVTINTAGGEKTIPGLLDEDADALRDKVARLASLAREEV